jgi:diacylglycerol kinase (ATP)
MRSVVYCGPDRKPGRTGEAGKASLDQRTVLIINPRRGHGAGAQLDKMELVLKALAMRYDKQFTEHSGHARVLAEHAVSEGYEIVVAVGGDGTVNEVVNGIVGSSTTLGALPLGGNNDFLRSLGISTWQEACLIVAKGAEAQLDLGLAEYVQEDGREASRYYAVLADIGFGSQVVLNTPGRFKHSLGGGLGYVISLYRTAAQGQARARRMRVEGDGEVCYDENLLLVEALNGSYAGGGLKVAPDARMDDGLLNVFVAKEMHWLAIWALFPRIYRGTHLEHEKAGYFRAREVIVEAERETVVSVDGDVVGHTPSRLCIVPGALKVRCKAPADLR